MVSRSYLCLVKRENVELYRLTFDSRMELGKFLRSNNVKFRNDTLSNLNGTVSLNGQWGLRYIVKGKTNTLNVVVDGNREYVPLKYYCALTGQSISTVYKKYKEQKIRGISLGKKNLVYIYWRDR